MKISIVNPNLSGDLSLLDLGITYLCTFINRRTRHTAEIIDFTYHRRNWKKHLLAKLDQQMPDVLGISATSLFMGYCRDIILAAKKTHPNLNIIMGGWHCSIDPEDSIRNYPLVEALVIGDGEFPLRDYLDRLEARQPLDGIRGLWFKDAHGQIVRNEKRPIFFTYRPLPKTKGADLVTAFGGRVKGWDGIDSLHQKSNISSPTLKASEILWFRYKCIIYFTWHRSLKLIRKQKGRFLVNLLRVLCRGLQDGIGVEYAIGYFYICSGDNLYE